MKLFKLFLFGLIPATIALHADETHAQQENKRHVAIFTGQTLCIKGHSRYAIKKGNLTPEDWQRRDKDLAEALGLTHIQSFGYDKLFQELGSFGCGPVCFEAKNTGIDPVLIEVISNELNQCVGYKLNYNCWDSTITNIIINK
jgi:hypothetical protein